MILNLFNLNLNFANPFGNSHHSAVSFNIDVNLENKVLPQTPKYQLDMGDCCAMNSYFKETNWDSIFVNEQDLDILWNKLELEILSAKDKFIPKNVKQITIS